MAEDDDLLELGPRRRPGVATVIAAVAVLVALAGYVVWQHGGSNRPSAAATSLHPSTSVGSSLPLPPPVTRSPSSLTTGLPPWPQVDGACGNIAFLPITNASTLRGRTGVRVVVGDKLRVVDVDTGRVGSSALPAGRYASTIVQAGSGLYALTATCGITDRADVVRVEPSGAVRRIATGPFSSLLPMGQGVWAISYTEQYIVLDRLDGSKRERLPGDFDPLGGANGVLAGTATNPDDPNSPSRIELFDPAHHVVVRTLDTRAASAGFSQGVLMWIDTHCPRRGCALHGYDVASGRLLSWPGTVPSGQVMWGAVLSSDRTRLAWIQQGTHKAPYDQDHPGKPNVVMTQRLSGGRPTAVPGLLLWSKSIPGLTWSADSRWLVMSIDAGNQVELLLWRSGMARPMRASAAVRGRVAQYPMVALTD